MTTAREERGIFRRALVAVYAWLKTMEYTSFEYTLDRINHLEREVGELKKELRQIRDARAVDTHNGSATRLED